MVADASVHRVPVSTGGTGQTQVRSFYRDVFIGSSVRGRTTGR
jgi:hypothetical protein